MASMSRRRTRSSTKGQRDLGSEAASLLYLVGMIAVVVVVDWRFLRRDLWRRLVVNVSIVLVFLVVYWMSVYQP